MKSILLTYCFLSAIFLPNSFYQKPNPNTFSDSSGVCGTVVFRSGNYMPSVGEKKSTYKGKVVEREIVFYELTNVTETSANGSFYNNIKTREVKRVWSDKAGKFKVLLQPGSYSVFVKEKDGYFANRFDGHNNICPIEVKEGKMTELNLVIDYNAAY